MQPSQTAFGVQAGARCARVTTFGIELTLSRRVRFHAACAAEYMFLDNCTRGYNANKRRKRETAAYIACVNSSRLQLLDVFRRLFLVLNVPIPGQVVCVGPASGDFALFGYRIVIDGD